MTIAFNKYVDITSGVAAAPAASTRELIGRIISINPLVPVGSVLEFTTLESVGTYFGTSSEEYKRASFYFSYISKLIVSPNKLSFSRWVKTATAPLIFGAKVTATVSALAAITNGSFTLTIGGVVGSVTGLTFAGSASYAAVATALQTAIRAVGSGTQFTSATVTYDNTRNAFNFTGGDATVSATISVSDGVTGTNIAELIGWLPQGTGGSSGAIWSDGSTVESITDTLTDATNVSNNFGSFVFTSEAALTIDEVVEAATWNAAQNVLFQYYVPVLAANATAWSAALIGFAGCGVTLDPAVAGEFPEMAPMLILASTNFDAQNSVQNYMFQQFNLTPSVSTTADSDAYDALRINYYGVTQQAGQPIAFYQRGVLMGPSTSPAFMNVYGNEQWLKDAAGTAIINLLLAVGKVSANAQGVTQLLTAIQAPIDQALLNGVISLGKSLTTTQKLYINTLTNDPNAWRQVQNGGYWVTCYITSETNSGATNFVANYLLIYSKDDVINKVVGQHVLI